MKRSFSIAVGLGALLIVALGWIWWAHERGGAAAARVPVLGGDAGGIARAVPASEHFDADALAQAAAAAAAEPGFEALIVMRHEHIVLERYAFGTAADTVIDSGALAQGVLGLLVGIAARDDSLPRTEISGFHAERLRAGIETAARTPYAVYLGRKLWRPLNAAPAWIALPQPGSAAPADCCLHTRVLDWMRVAGVLVGDGRFEGTTVAPAGWVARMLRPVSADGRHGFGLELAGAAQGLEPFALEEAFFLRGPAHWRLWMLPSAHLAVLFGAHQQPATTNTPPWDETRIPNLVFRALSDQPAPTGPAGLLQRLVPGH
jgi:hypothetical protein